MRYPMNDSSLLSNLFKLTTLKVLTLLAIVVSGGGMISDVHAQGADEVVAVVNGRRITQKEVDDSAVSQLFPLEQQLYAIRKLALENLIIRAILEGEAKKRSTSVEELRQQLSAGEVKVLPSQVEKEYLENAAAFGTMSPDEAKEKLRLDLESQARIQNYREALSRLRQDVHIEFLLKEPKLLSVASVDSAPSIGAKDATITITEFADYHCPYCREAQGTVKRILKDYGKDVRFVFKHLPLDIHAQSFASAQAAVCAGEQGLFWQYSDALFAADSLSTEARNSMALKFGLDGPEFQSCLTSERSRTAVLKDMQEAKRLGVAGTPTFIINDTLIRGALSFEDFKGAIEAELKSARSGLLHTQAHSSPER